MTKTRKSISKRFKITKKGKFLRRKTGLDHYRAKKSGQEIRQRRKMVAIYKPNVKKFNKSASTQK